MKILFENELGKVIRYNGTIEVLGQGEMVGNKNIEGHPVNIAGTYDYIRLIETDGSVRMLPRLTAYNSVGSYLKPGFSGTLYVFTSEDKTENGAVLAMVSNGRRANDITDFIISIQAVAASIKRFKKAAILFLPVGIFTIYFIIGIPVVIVSLWALYKFNKIERKIKMLPSAEELQRMIEGDTLQLDGEPIGQQ